MIAPFKTLKVVALTIIAILSFAYSTVAWKHVQSSEQERILVGAIILVAMYALMVFELIDRNLAALLGAAASVAAHDCLIERATMEQIIQWEDLETLALLFGMMVMVNVLGSSGVFEFIAIWSYKQANGHFWVLITIVALITGLLSAFIDNVSTMLLISPTLIKLSELEHIDPRYVLMIMVLFCNIGGCATPVGDPPNLIIIGDHLIQELGISFASFVAYCGPCVLLTVAVILLYLRLVYKSKDNFRPSGYQEAIACTPAQHDQDGKVLIDMEQSKTSLDGELEVLQLIEIEIHSHPKSERMKKMLREVEGEISVVEKKLQQLNDALSGQNHLRVSDASAAQISLRRGSRLTENEISQLMRKFSIRSKPILIQSTCVLVATILLFFVQSTPSLNLTLGWISLFAALTLLVMSSASEVPNEDDTQDEQKTPKTDRDSTEQLDAANGQKIQTEKVENFERVINNVEWSTLMFFFSLFIVMEVMAKLGLITFMGEQITQLVNKIPPGQWRSIGAITIILWASGLASACIDNVPFTSMMIKVLGTMVLEQRIHARNMDNLNQLMSIKPLVFALAFGACYGGNGTLIGASANLVTAGISSRHGYPISFNGFTRFALPITLISLVIANVYLVMVFVVFEL